MTDSRTDYPKSVPSTTSPDHMPSTRFNPRGRTLSDWRGIARRRWPILAAGFLLLVLLAWVTSRGDPEPAGEAAAEAPAQPDSLLVVPPAAQRLAGIELVVVNASTSGELIANGAITFDANHVSVLSSRAEGRVVSVAADLGQQVSAGAVLALIQSPLIGQTRGALERAQVSLEAARRNYEREQRLFAQSISSQKELLEAEAAYRSAEADRRSAVAELEALGASAGRGASFSLVSPINGMVVERNASPGQAVDPSTNLFTVADLRHVWITVDIYERDIQRVNENAQAVVTPSALPGESFPGRVTYAGGIVDPASRTFKVRVELENPGRRLRPGMFAQVHIKTPRMATDPSISVPELAVQDVGGQQVVFVATGKPGEFIVRPVTLGPATGNGMVAVTAGLRGGERIVGTGAFQLKAELMKASFGEED